jgi:hypothetical protein
MDWLGELLGAPKDDFWFTFINPFTDRVLYHARWTPEIWWMVMATYGWIGLTFCVWNLEKWWRSRP